MLDIKTVRQDPERVKQAVKNRCGNLDNEINELLEIDVQRREIITLVEELKAATTLAQRRAIIHLANASAPNAEGTYTGVSQAKTDLATEIAEFEADVAAANAALEGATKGAYAIVSSVGDGKIFVDGN